MGRSVKEVRIITALELRAMILLMKPRVLLGFFAARAH